LYPHDAEARITKMKDGRTHLAIGVALVSRLDAQRHHRPSVQIYHLLSLVRETLSEAGREITTTMAGTMARENAVGSCAGVSQTGVQRVVADKGYHSRDSVKALAEVGARCRAFERQRPMERPSADRGACFGATRLFDFGTRRGSVGEPLPDTSAYRL